MAFAINRIGIDLYAIQWAPARHGLSRSFLAGLQLMVVWLKTQRYLILGAAFIAILAAAVPRKKANAAQEERKTARAVGQNRNQGNGSAPAGSAPSPASGVKPPQRGM